MVGGLRGDRVDQRLLGLPGAEVGLGDGAGVAATVAGRVIGHHVGRPDQPGRLDGDQLRIARAEPDPE
jgi:hypothetical protein